ncbi:MAG: FG-GAP repeat domain-containing protein, partial [Armatimonadota bacterium]
MRVAMLVLVAATGVSAQPMFVDVTERSGLSGGGTAAWADYDADGWVDVAIGGRLFRNVEGRFEAAEAALPEGTPGGSATWGDCDNDGDLDLFIFGGRFALLLNDGDGTFSDGCAGLPEVPVVQSLGAAWVDLSADGLLDLYVGGYETWEEAVYPDAVLVNEGDGQFREAWRSSEEGTRS